MKLQIKTLVLLENRTIVLLNNATIVLLNKINSCISRQHNACTARQDQIFLPTKMNKKSHQNLRQKMKAKIWKHCFYFLFHFLMKAAEFRLILKYNSFSSNCVKTSPICAEFLIYCANTLLEWAALLYLKKEFTLLLQKMQFSHCNLADDIKSYIAI